ncbi:unnamed protein product [Rotaria sp. Silwood2]|nr:unnamed protein product [Rotaria sp. Silwood2]
MCICDSDRFSNCFQFNKTKKYNCSGKNLCYNDSQCFLNNETCPTAFICVCNDWYYGRQYQFSTKDFIFSLDQILGYHIKPSISVHQQPFIVKLSIITTIMLILELIIGSLSIATFKVKTSREVGCGYYLLVSSISSMCMIIVLTIKFWQLVLSQMSIITNGSIMFIDCISIEIILKSCLVSSEWLNDCVAMERMFNVIKVAARSRVNVESKLSFKQHFRLKLKQHKNIIIAPSILLVLGLPRLIISFTSGCMRSPRQSWLYLIGYFVSFIPSMSTFFVFILPSKNYKSEFDKIIQRWIRPFRRRS